MALFTKTKILALSLALGVGATNAQAFEINFTWDGLELCTSGSPNRVSNPVFALKNVPEGTKFIRFRLVDQDVPNYNHGGGVVKYTGQKSIQPGAFKYKSPCPPNGRHTYQWQASAQTKKNGGKLATTARTRKYP